MNTLSEVDLDSGLLRRFWSKVEKLGNESGCWLWIGACTKAGYGNFWPKSGFFLGAHRTSWAIKHGHIDPNLSICHKCDTPSCVNPDHLFLGDHVDNAVDSFRKGRGQEGERHYNTKLRSEDVLAIKREYAEGSLSQEKIAKKFGIKQMAVSNIVTGKNWKKLQ